MFLASILALWLLTIPCAGITSSTFPVAGEPRIGDVAPLLAQSSSQEGSPSNQTETKQPPASQGSTPSTSQPPSNPPKQKHKKKAASSSADESASPKKVVPHGSTGEPQTHLAPSMSDEQTAKTKATNTDLLNQAQANLQKINGRTLTPEQQETADHVRKFVEQSKAADQEGDLQRAGTLANKAKLLSDSLEETSRPK